MLLQPARQREASAREHFLEAASGPTSEGSLHICSAHIGKLAIAVALDLVPNGSGGRRVVGVASSHTDHPAALVEPPRSPISYARYNPAVLVGRPQLVVRNSDQVVVAVPNTCPVAGGHHSRIVSRAEPLRSRQKYYGKIGVRCRPPTTTAEPRWSGPPPSRRGGPVNGVVLRPSRAPDGA